MAFPDASVALIDDFNRAAPLGSNWSAPTGQTIATISSNTYNAGSNARRMSFWNVGRFGPDAQFVVDLPTSYSIMAIFVSPDPATTLNGYAVEANPNADFSRVHRLDAGTSTVLNSNSILDWNNGHQLGMEIAGTTFNCWHGRSGVWTSEATASDSRYSGPWYVGLWVDWTNQRLDNFSGVTISAGSPPVGALSMII